MGINVTIECDRCHYAIQSTKADFREAIEDHAEERGWLIVDGWMFCPACAPAKKSEAAR